jgi:prepilin-type N-terminal cleavage/methylation domain-containing protein
MNRPKTKRQRFGFTLIELMVVILIVGILIALLLPAIFGAVARGKNAAVSAEIITMAQALESFKSDYGDYPPSRIILMENGAFDTTNQTALSQIAWLGNTPVLSSTDLNYGQLAQRSLRFLRKFFPKVQFSSTSVQPAVISNAFFYDFNGNNVADTSPILLEGHECLVFFLGGIPNHAGGVESASGFGKDPKNPFVSATLVANRNNPRYEFRNSQLVDDDFDGIPGYVDSLASGTEARYFAYFSSYGGGSYDPNDVNFLIDLNDNTQTAIARVFRVNHTVVSPGGAFPTVGTLNGNNVTNWVVSWAPNPYTDSLPVIPGSATPAAYEKSNSFQIISAGRDRNYGVGGQYITNGNGDRLPIDDFAAAYHSSPISCSLDSGVRQRERDNLTNFSTSTLD